MTSPEESPRTPDGRYLLIGGWRWRASDPSTPDAFRAELVAELMAARRLVRRDPAAARPRVQDAKVALGERGRPWWQDPTQAAQEHRIEAVIRGLLRHRDGKTICPSDVARVLGGQTWRPLMDTVGATAWRLVDSGDVVITQGGRPAQPDAKGPLRIGVGLGLGLDDGLDGAASGAGDRHVATSEQHQRSEPQ